LFREIVRHGLDIVILRMPAGAASKLSGLERHGMAPIHADTLVYYQNSLCDRAPNPVRNGDVIFSVATEADRSELTALISSTFAGYISHYHANPALHAEDILAGYAEWALGYTSNDVDDRITWIARRNGEMVAFACCSDDEDTGTCEGVLYGVHPDHSGGGLYGDLIRFTQAEFRARGRALMRVSTQVWNLAVQKVWAREGFLLSHAYDTFHINSMLSAGELLVDRSISFDASQVAQFAAVTGDKNPIHLDDDAARGAGFEARITHGMLAGGELSRIFGTEVPGFGTLFLRSNFVFTKPVYCGRRHRLRIRYVTRRSSPDRLLAVATLHDEAGNLCLLCYSDLLKRA
jgi:acyl dehydratase